MYNPLSVTSAFVTVPTGLSVCWWWRIGCFMKFGRAFHCYVLEEENFDKEFIIPSVFPVKPNKRSTQKTIDTYNEWMISHPNSQMIISSIYNSQNKRDSYKSIAIFTAM